MRKTPLFLCGIAVGVALLGGPASAHDVKDPVCRMTVDSDTTKYQHKLGSKTFYFCSKKCETSFVKTPEKYEKLAAQLEKESGRDYTVDLTTTPQEPMAGQPVQMAFAIRYADNKTLVPSFEVIHERFLHLLMVREDLAWFEHQHPEQGKDGIFRLTWRFPTPGRYTLYADFTPADGDNQIKPLPLTVGGGSPETLPLKPDTQRVKQIGDYRIELRVQPEPLRMEKAAVLTYTVRDRQGRPIRDMQPFIGAPGHLIAISQDGKEVVHTHAIHGTTLRPDEAGAVHVTPVMATEKGPAFSFKLTTPTAGLYKTWAQFMHANRVLTVPFTFKVEELWADVASGPPTRRRAPGPGAASATAPRKAGQKTTVQRATVVIDGEYQPATVSVKAGLPVELTFVRKEAVGCGDVVQFPKLGLKRTLKPGEKTVVMFTPRKAQTLRFTCGMSMYQGKVVVN